jgi:hypothetical protein
MVKLKYGAMGVQRDGKEVGPFEPSGNTVLPFAWGGQIWREDGTWRRDGRTSDYDIVLVIDAPAAELSRVDLTKNKTPIALMEAKELAALKAHKGKIQFLNCDGKWIDIINPVFGKSVTYRAKPEPRQPREWWMVIDNSAATPCAVRLSEADAKIYAYNRTLPGDFQSEVVHVREVIDDVVESLPSC